MCLNISVYRVTHLSHLKLLMQEFSSLNQIESRLTLWPRCKPGYLLIDVKRLRKHWLFFFISWCWRSCGQCKQNKKRSVALKGCIIATYCLSCVQSKATRETGETMSHRWRNSCKCNCTYKLPCIINGMFESLAVYLPQQYVVHYALYLHNLKLN